ncbi:MAG: CocE/NonD family hydrolase, partial [Roseburia sp.]|nr:CocE/NonD family hydrolase [Roseburia sp.]
MLPSEDGTTPAAGRFPAVFEISRGGRGISASQFDAEYLVKHGYAWVMLEMRGCGASFGVNNSFASLENRLDVKYVMENWLPAQAWSNGTCAMEGGSNRGLIQWATATTAPEGLKAISPIVNNPDFYYQDYRNGASCVPSGRPLSGTNLDAQAKPYDEWIQKPGVTFVDDDPEGRTAYQAYVYYTEHNMPFTQYLLAPNLNRDQPNDYLYGEQVNLTIPAVEYSDEIKASGIQVHQIAGWYDANATFQIASANAWGGQIVIGPWGHGGAIRGGYSKNDGAANATEGDKLNVDVEQLRWYDYVLKGVDNGYEDAPKFYYYVVNAAKGEEWRYSDTFPLDNSVNSVLYLAPETSGEVLGDALKLDGPQSNNGKLSLVKPGSSSVDYKVDLSVQPEGFSNLDLSATGEMTPVDSKGLTYTSAPLSSAAEIVGIPSVDLWISSADTDDADFVCYLEEVKADGTSHMITQGVARASHRATGANDLWDSTQGLAGRYHTSLTSDVEAALAQGLDTPVLLQFNLEAIAYRVASGSSLRLTVTCANTGVYQHQMYYKTNADGSYAVGEDGAYVMMDEDELPTIKLYQGGDRASLVNIPIVENVSNTFNGTVTFADGSYAGPGTMYLFDDNWFLYANGKWTKLSTANGENAYTVNAAGAAVFAAGFTFLPEGSRVVKNGIAQNYQGGQAHVQPFPTRFNLNVDTVVNQTGNTNANMLLYLPVSKTLDVNLFMPTGWKQGDAPVPVILYIHGFGGTCIDLDTNLLSLLDAGYALAGVDLRNYPPNESPLYYQDIKGNIRYLRANAGWLGIDPDRIGIYGVSLGGNTSLMMLLSGGDEEMEGAVGGNLDVSSRVQAGICGYAWSDAIYFGQDQRDDNDYNFELMRSMISGGDGENAPCAQAVNFSGPGKGYLVLRNYLEARRAAEAAGTLTQFLAQPYTLTIDKAYVDHWFPGQEGATNAFIGSGATVTLGTYTYEHSELMAAVERAQKASPAYYASADDPVIVVFGGFGGSQNITNQQSVRTETAMQDAGAKAFYFGSSVTSWNDYTRYGNPAAIQAAFRAYWDNYLKGTPSGTKLVLTEGEDTALVNYVERTISAALRVENGQPMFPAEVINLYLGTDLTGYVTADQVKDAAGASVTWYAEEKMAVITVNGSIPKFADAASNHWASDGIVYSAVRGVMKGTADTLFAPDQAVTRAMAVTTLYRASGSPAVSGASRYTDAGTGLWYSDAILWAEQQGVADLFGGSAFGVDEIITREQLAVLLYRCAKGAGGGSL